MTAAERRALLGDDVIEHIRDEAAQAPTPPEELLQRLRPILTGPARRRPSVAAARPAA